MSKHVNSFVLVRGVDRTGLESGSVVAMCESQELAGKIILDSHDGVRSEIQNGEPWQWVESEEAKDRVAHTIIRVMLSAHSIYTNVAKGYSSFYAKGGTITKKVEDLGSVIMFIPDTDAG